MEPLYVGIDVSKRELVVSAWVNQQVLDLDTVANDEAGFAQLTKRLDGQRRAKQAVHLVLEPTGGYELPLVAWAWQKGWEVSLPNPWQVRRWAESQGRRAKTDKVDSRVLTQYGVTVRPALARPLPAHLAALDQLLRRKEDLAKMLREEQNRQHSLKGRPGLPPAVLESLDQVTDALRKALAEIEAEIETLLANHAKLQKLRRLLLTVSGVGPKTVLPLLVFLGRWDALTDGQGDAKGLTAYVGLDPTPFTSGHSVFKRPTISKKGNRSMRTALFLAAKAGTINGDSPLRQFYLRLRGNDKPARLAWTAAARKILVWSWAVFRDECPFQPDKALSSQSAY